MTVGNLLRVAAASHPQRIALRMGAESITYSDLDTSSQQIASGWAAGGYRPGERVVVWSTNSPAYVLGVFSLFKAGLIAVPVNPRLHPREVATIVSDCEASAVLIDETMDEQRDKLSGELQLKIPILSFGEMPHGRLGRELNLRRDALAWLFYTSGTTGAPKGAMLSHENLVAMSVSCLADMYSFGPSDIALHIAPLSHGSGLYLLPGIGRASTHVLLPGLSLDASLILETIAQQHVTVIPFATPTILIKLLNDPSVDSTDLSSLKRIIYGGAPMHLKHLRRAIERFGPILTQLYGQGESPMTLTYLPAECHRLEDADDLTGPLTSVGIARTGTDVRIEVDGKEATGRNLGEVAVRGPTVMRGYWQNPQATSEAIEDGWLRTGDIGWRDESGRFYLVDRVKDLIISGGSNVYAREVEDVILTLSGIADVAIVGLADDYWGERVHAVIVRAEDSNLDSDQVIRHCRRKLAAYKIPRSVEFVRELPRNAYGKVLKRELRAQSRKSSAASRETPAAE